VSTTRPIIVLHSNGHLLNVNSRLMDMAGITADTNVYGVLKDDNGKPTGELMEMAAKYMAYRQTGNPFFGGIKTPSLLRYAESAVNCGVTTATDLFASFNEGSLAAYVEASQTPGYALRLMPALNTIEQSIDEGIALAKRALQDNNDRLHHRLCKVMTDGSIQGFTARMKWPGYHNGKPNGLWNLDPDTLGELVLEYHKAGLHLHIHTNGDEASELMLDALEAAQLACPRPDHRHTLQHCQMADASQFRRMAKLGVCVNLFANHIYYWGDQHAAITMGPDRANRMDAAGTAQREGVHFSIHSDAPVTPMAPLFTAWCAVNRQTRTGTVLGPEEQISAEDALYAITLGAAYTLHMDHLVGSIEPGKYADFAVLEDSPLQVSPDAIRDIGVWGTISGGAPHKAATRTG
jgi:predicted amidohydrolase YtcJ